MSGIDTNDNLLMRFELVEVDDHGEIQSARGTGRKGESFGGKKFKPPRYQPYGHSANPPKGSIGVFISLGGNIDQGFIAWAEHPDHRPKGQQPGENQIYDDQGQYVKLARDKIEIKTTLPVSIQGGATITLKATSIILDGNCYIGGADATLRASMVGTLDSGGDLETTTGAATKVFLK